MASIVKLILKGQGLMFFSQSRGKSIQTRNKSKSKMVYITARTIMSMSSVAVFEIIAKYSKNRKLSEIERKWEIKVKDG